MHTNTVLVKLQETLPDSGTSSAAPEPLRGGSILWRVAVRTAMIVCGIACVILPAIGQKDDRDFKTLDPPGSAIHHLPLGINNRGDIAGYYGDALGLLHGFVRIDGKFRTVDFPGALMSGCGGINDDGDVSGTYFDAHGFQHGYRLHKGKFHTIDVPGAAQTTGIRYELGPGLGTAAFGINEDGDIVGEYADAAGVAHGYRLRDGEFKTIDFPGAFALPGLGTNTFNINDEGDIAGVYYTPFPPFVHGFVRRHDKFIPVEFPGSGGFFGTQSNGINNRGDIVGLYSDPANNGHGFLIHEGQAVSIDFPGAPFTECHCINDHGVITGLYQDAMGISYGFISTR